MVQVVLKRPLCTSKYFEICVVGLFFIFFVRKRHPCPHLLSPARLHAPASYTVQWNYIAILQPELPMVEPLFSSMSLKLVAMTSIVDIINKYYIIEPAASTDLSDVQLKNTLNHSKDGHVLPSIRVSKLSPEDKIRMAERLDLSIFKRYTCLVCVKSFVQKKRDGRSRLVRHLKDNHGISVPTTVAKATEEISTGSPEFKNDSLPPLTGTFDEIFRDEIMTPLLPTQTEQNSNKFVEHICKLVCRFNVAALFFGNELFKDGMGDILGARLPHLPSLIIEKGADASDRIEALIAGQKHVALAVNYLDYGQIPVQSIVAYFLGDDHHVTKRLLSFKAVGDDEDKIDVLKRAIAHWKLDLKVLSITTPDLEMRNVPGLVQKKTTLEKLFPLRIPCFNELAKSLIDTLFQEELSTCEMTWDDTQYKNMLRIIVLKLKNAVNYVKENATRETGWRNSLKVDCGWSARDTDILLWNGAQWTEFCDILARVPQFINPLNEFLLSQHRPDLAFSNRDIEAMGLVLNLIRPLCSWVLEFASDTIQIHNYHIHLKKLRLLLAYMSMCDLFESRVPEASRVFEMFVERVESDKPLFKFLLAAYILSGCFTPYDDTIFDELKEEFVEILSEDPDFLSADPQGEVSSFIAYTSSSRKPEPLPEKFWEVHKEQFPCLFKLATVVLTVRPVTLSLAANTGKYVLNHLRSPRHLSRSEMLLVLAMEDDS